MRDNAPSFHALPSGTVLNGVYTVEAELGQGGYGIVYRARHRDLGCVAIKEYLPAELAVREGRSVHPRSTHSRKFFEEGMERFLEEAKQLIKFRAHPSIVSCRDFFRVNGTAYLVMDFEEGLPLSKLLEARESEGRPFEETDLLSVMVPLLEGLAQVHEAGVLHRDVKPSNILIRRGDERPVLIDFGAAKREFARHSKSLAPYTPGYAAIEQVSEGRLGAWTDMYGIGGVMWRMVAGGNRPYEPPQPVRVERRVNARFRGEPDPLPTARELGKGRFSERVLGAIDRCLKLKETDRVKGCKELVSLLNWKEGSGEVGGGSQLGREAIRSYLLAANKGDTRAMEKLGDMYRDGTWVPKPGGETVKMFRRGADQGHAFAMCMLGRMYRDGKGVPRDYSEALVWYRRAAEKGNAAAQCKFGDMYRFGDRVPQSDKEAVKWYRRSAEQGHVEAQYNLGVMYRYGKGVPQSDKEAVKWYRLAADQGNTKAMNALKQAESREGLTGAGPQVKRLDWSKWAYPMLLALSFVPILLMVLVDESLGSSNFSRFIFFVFLCTLATLAIGLFSPASKLRKILGVISLIGMICLLIVAISFGMASEVLSFPALSLIGIFGGLAIRAVVAKGAVF